MHLVALQSVLVITGFLGGVEGQLSTVTLSPYEANPPDEYVEVTEGDNLTMTCAVANYWPRNVYWGKTEFMFSVWLTKDSDVYPDNSRVSVRIFQGEHYNIYSLQISNILTEDSGTYFCHVPWKNWANRVGYVDIFVRNFPKDKPSCYTIQAASSTSFNSVYCDTVNSYPGVNVTWTINGAGDDDIPNSNVFYHFYRGRVRSELRLNSNVLGNRRTRKFVCTVTSSEFPGLNHTCSVNVILGRDVTTEAYFVGTVPSTATGSLDSGFTGVDNEETTSESLPETKGSDVTQIPSGSPVVVTDNTLAIALVIPALFIVLATVLICVLKRQRQRKNQRGFGTNKTTSPNDQTNPSAGEVVDPFSLAQLQNDTYADISNSSNNTGLNGKDVSPRAGQFDPTSLPYSVTPLQKQTIDSDAGIPSLSCKPTEDVENHTLFPFEIELDLNGDCVVYSQIPDESAKRDLKGRSSDHKTVKAEHSEERQEDTGYELLKIDCQDSSTSVPKLRTNLPRKIVGQAQQNGWPADELEGADDHFIQDESEEGSVINPIYEPFEKGYKGQYPVPTTQDESWKWSSPENAMVKSDNPAEHQVDNIHYEVLNVDNPIYEPFGNGKTN